MNAEEEKWIKLLLDSESSPTQQETAMTWLSNYLEEGDILNLPPSKRTLEAMSKFSRKASFDAKLKSKAKKILQQYRR